jgi:hypothetical protein
MDRCCSLGEKEEEEEEEEADGRRMALANGAGAGDRRESERREEVRREVMMVVLELLLWASCEGRVSVGDGLESGRGSEGSSGFGLCPNLQLRPFLSPVKTVRPFQRFGDSLEPTTHVPPTMLIFSLL